MYTVRSIASKIKNGCLFLLCLTIVVFPVVSIAQQAPIADAGPASEAIEGNVVLLDGSGSSDPDPASFESAVGSSILPGGTQLSIALDDVDETGSLIGSVSIGEGDGAADTAIVYIVDVSGSANFAGGCAGDQNGDGIPNRIIDCEIAAALALHTEVLSSGTVKSVGLVAFSSSARVEDLNPNTAGIQALISPDADSNNNGILDFEETLRNIRVGGGTSFTPAVQLACEVLAGSDAPNRIAVMLSDGQPFTFGTTPTSQLPCDPAVKFETFAIGGGSACEYRLPEYSLKLIAESSGGTCVNVPDVSELPAILPDIVSASIYDAFLVIDDGTPIDISDSIEMGLPQAGPATFEISPELPVLANGIHNLCVKVSALDSGGDGTLETCARLSVGIGPLTYRWTVIEDAGLPVILSSPTEQQTTFFAFDDGEYQFRLTVTDGSGLSAFDDVIVSVQNKTPELVLEPAGGFIGDATIVSGTFADVGYLDTHEIVIDWGDGSTDTISPALQGAGWGSLIGSHRYTSVGQYDISVVVIDDDGGIDEAFLSQVSINAPLAVFANRSGSNSIEWTGAEGLIEGSVHVNGELDLNGASKTFIGPVTFTESIQGNQSRHQFSESPQQSVLQPFPEVINFADFRPGSVVQGATGARFFDMSESCQAGVWREPQTTLESGVYYASCDIVLNGSDIGGAVTLASEGSVSIIGSRPAFEPYYRGVLAVSAGIGDRAIDISTSDSKFLGILYARNGEIEITGSDNRFYCGLYADYIDLSGTGIEVRGANCTGEAATSTSITMLPQLQSALQLDADSLLPGEQAPIELMVSNEGARLIVSDLLGLENVDANDTFLRAFRYVVETYSIADQRWNEMAVYAEVSDGYIPDISVEALGEMNVIAVSVEDGGVDYPQNGLIDTRIYPTGYATWGVQSIVKMSPDQVSTLLDSTVTGGLRLRAEYEFEPDGVQIRRLQSFGPDLSDGLAPSAGDIRDIEISLSRPTGESLSQLPGSFDLLSPGSVAILGESLNAPSLDGRVVGESISSYINRLASFNSQLLSASMFISAQSDAGRIFTPIVVESVRAHVPIVTLDGNFPDEIVLGDTASYSLSVTNTGLASANGVALSTSLNGTPVTAAPAVSSVLAPGQVSTTDVEKSLSADDAAGSLFFDAELTWSDAAGNGYGPAGIAYQSIVTRPPALVVELVDALGIDRDFNGVITAGDQIQYSLSITNSGSVPTGATSVTLQLDELLTPAIDTLSVSTGEVGSFSGNTLTIDLNQQLGGSTTLIEFAVDIPSSLPENVISVTSQGNVETAEIGIVLSDDPGIAGINDPTVTSIAVPYPVVYGQLSSFLSVDANASGAVSPGDTVTWELNVTNGGFGDANNLLIELPIPDYTSLVDDSIVVSSTDLTATTTDSGIAVETLAFAAGRTEVIVFQTRIDEAVPSSISSVSIKARMTPDNAIPSFSDDPNTLEENDATKVSFDSTNGSGSGGDPLNGGNSGGIMARPGEQALDYTNDLPSAQLTAPLVENGLRISGKSSFTSTLQAPEGETVVSWTVSIRPMGSLELTQIASASGNDISIEIDASAYRNGLYGVVVESETSGGGFRREESFITIDGAFKAARFAYEIFDESVLIDDITLQLSRSYDSLDIRSSDFGIGWSLAIASFEIQSNGYLGEGGWTQTASPSGLFFSNLDYNTSRPHFVSVNWPGGLSEIFDLKPTPSISLFPQFTSATFVARNGSSSTLEAIDSQLHYGGDGNLYGGSFGADGLYNPRKFRLTAATGIAYIIDKDNGLEEIVYPDGSTVSFSRNGIAYSSGETISYERGENDVINAIVIPDGSRIEYTYDDSGRLISVKRPSGLIETYSYDHPKTNLLTSVSVPDDASVKTIVYDSNGIYQATLDAAGNRTSQSFDPESFVVTITDRRGASTENHYDDKGNLARVVYADNTYVEYRYEDVRHPFEVTKEVDAIGRETRYEYDDRGLTTAIHYPEGTAERFSYDSFGRIAQITSVDGTRQSYEYGVNGQQTLWRIEFPNGTTEEHYSEFDVEDRISRAYSTTGLDVRFGYSGDLPIPSRIEHVGGITYDAEYDRRGNITRIEDSNGASIDVVYTSFDEPLRISSEGRLLLEAEYGNDERLIATIVEGLRETYSYDSMSRLATIAEVSGITSSFEYDEEGNLLSFTGPSGDTISYEYDIRGRKTAEIDALGARLEYSYDSVGRMTHQTDRLGRQRIYAYDEDDNVIEESWLSSTGELIRNFTFAYNSEGNLLLATDEAHRHEYQYDGRQLIAEAMTKYGNLPAMVLSYEHNALGMATAVSENGTLIETTEFDSRGRHTAKNWLPPTGDSAHFRYSRDSDGSIISIERLHSDDAAHSESSFSADNSVAESLIEHRKADNTLVRNILVTKDSQGQPVRENSNGVVTSIEYDAVGQVINVVSDNANKSEYFEYDGAGNRIDGNEEYGPGDRIIRSGPYEFEFDIEGNLVKLTDTASATTEHFTYDHVNQLILYEKRDSSDEAVLQISYQYDFEGRRTREVIDPDGVGPQPSDIRYLYYDDVNRWADADAGGVIVARYVFDELVDQVLARSRVEDGLAFYFSDAFGSVRDVLGADGTVLNSLEYSTFGRIIEQLNAADHTEFTFTSREPLHAQTALMHYRTRIYSPTHQRFLSEDSIRYNSGDPNLYRYVLNSPFLYVDPFGTASVEYGAAVRGVLQDAVIEAFRCLGLTVACEIFKKASALELARGLSIYGLIPVEGACAYFGKTKQKPRARFGKHGRSKSQCQLKNGPDAPRGSTSFDALVARPSGNNVGEGIKRAGSEGNLMELMEFMAVEIARARGIPLLNKATIIGSGPGSKYGGPAAFLRKRCTKKGYNFDPGNAGSRRR